MKPLTGRFVLIALCGFFGTVFAVNAVFATLARSSWPGLSEDAAYARGIGFNRLLEAQRDQQQRGWTAQLRYDAGRDVILDLRDGAGAPLAGLFPELELRAFGHQGLDHRVTLAPDGGGAYRGTLTLAAQRWEATLQVRDAAGVVVYRSIQDMQAAP
jgi:nitrogen fixation protein FixH